MARPGLPLPLQFLGAWIGLWVGRHQQRVIEYQRAELRLLREKLGARKLRFSDAERMRLARLGKELGRKTLGEFATLASPETILRWYRQLVAKKYDGSSKRAPGRPGVSGDITELVLRMAADTPRWGYTRMQGALANLAYEVGRTTIKRILLRHGVEPGPERKRQYSWATFIRAHLSAIAAMDFFTVEVVTMMGIVRMHVLFVTDLGSRIVEIAGIARDPDGSWMQQIARNLLDPYEGILRGKKYVLLDRDPVFTEAFREMLRRADVKALRLSARSPNLNAFAERFVLSCGRSAWTWWSRWEKHICGRSSWSTWCTTTWSGTTKDGQHAPAGEAGACQHQQSRTTAGAGRGLAQLLPSGGRLIGISVQDGERFHQGLGGPLVKPAEEPRNDNGSGAAVRRRSRLGGVLTFYHRRAA